MCLAVAALSGLVCYAKPLEVVNRGRTDFVIVKRGRRCCSGAIRSRRSYKSTSGLFPGLSYRSQTAARSQKKILIGQAAGALEVLNGKPEDSFLIRVTGNNVILAGLTPRSTLYAVYVFLEKYLGCGWIAPGDEYIPRSLEISLPERIEQIESPAFTYRAIALFPYTSSQLNSNLLSSSLFPYALMQVTKDRIDWAAKNRLNSVHPCTNEAGPRLWEKVNSRQEIVPEIMKRGLSMQYGGHSYFAWLPPG